MAARVLGVSAFYHDSAAALVVDGRILAAAQEERFTRRKHDSDFPLNAICWCLEYAGLKPTDIDRVAFYDKPFLKFERIMETTAIFAPRGFASFRRAAPVWLKEKLFHKRLLRQKLEGLAMDEDWEAKLLFAEHHQSHAASAFYPSPFSDAVILTLDGVGEWATTTTALGDGAELEIAREIHFPHSLGLFYSAFTYHAGFRVNSGEYKLMGLAPYGEPKYATRILDNLIDLKADGSFRLNLDYFNYCAGLTMTNRRFDALFGCLPRDPDEPLTQRHMDMAASAQAIVEEAVLRLARAARKETGRRNLCLAGGVALNCVANGKVLGSGCFDRIWIQPAAGDAGGALGAALLASHRLLGVPRQPAARATSSPGADSMQGALLGPEYADEAIHAELRTAGARFERLAETELTAAVAAALADGQTAGWFQGRMEFGPRALGNRSILADPRSPDMQRALNLKVKFRESFRPFAPSVLLDDVADWFQPPADSPYMLLAIQLRPERRRPLDPGAVERRGFDQLHVARSEVPAVTHVDYTARVQTVRRETNARYHALLEAFKARTGCPMLVNTSFNIRGEPIVCSPADAFRCFMGTDIDCLAIGDCFLRKADQDPALRADYRHAVAAD